jgi:hypothetical protein
VGLITVARLLRNATIIPNQKQCNCGAGPLELEQKIPLTECGGLNDELQTENFNKPLLADTKASGGKSLQRRKILKDFSTPMPTRACDFQPKSRQNHALQP